MHKICKTFTLAIFFSLIWFLGDLSVSQYAAHAEESLKQNARKSEATPFPITYGQLCPLLKQKKPQILLDSVPSQKEIDALNKNEEACVYIELKGIPSDFEIRRLNRIPHVCVVMHISSPIKSHDLKRLPTIKTSCALLEIPNPPTTHEVGYLNKFKGCVSLMLSTIPDHHQVSRISKMARGCVVQRLTSPIKDQDIDRINKLPCLFPEFTNIPTSHEITILKQLKQDDSITGKRCIAMTAWRSRSFCFTPAPSSPSPSFPSRVRDSGPAPAA
ncbi:MAG: hypothetical protein ABFQ95_05590 [Pseudomonadota bacterium]